jgi:hypothetical protein
MSGYAIDPEEMDLHVHAAAIYAIQNALLDNDVCRCVYGVLFWFDQHLQSGEAWATDIGIDLLFWRNPYSPYRDGLPPPFDRLPQLELDLTGAG